MQGILLPKKVKQLDTVPIYDEHTVVESTHPYPVVLQPVRNAAHSTSVVATVL